MLTPRRLGLKTLGLALATIGSAAASAAEPSAPAGDQTLEALTRRLAASPRRRDFKTVPMILDHRDLWDAQALDAVLRYSGGPKQCFDNVELQGGWLTVMRNALNAEVFAFHHPDFLCVSVVRGPALVALFDDAAWEKYGLAKRAGDKVTRNSFYPAPPAANGDRQDYQNPNGAFSGHADSIQALQRRGAVFMACHNAIWGLGERLIGSDANPDRLAPDAMCAELTNHLVPGVIHVPAAVGALAELGNVGFSYAR